MNVRSRSRCLLVSAALLVVPVSGCRERTSSTPHEAEPSSVPGSVRYYAGTFQLRLAGSEPQTGRTVLKRQIDPQQGLITETYTDADPRPTAAKKVFSTVWTVHNASFDVHEKTGDGDGTGTLLGTEWAWSEWTYDFKWKGGASHHAHVVVHGDDLEVTDTAQLREGGSRVTVVKQLSPVSAEKFQSELDALTRK